MNPDDVMLGKPPVQKKKGTIQKMFGKFRKGSTSQRPNDEVDLDDVQVPDVYSNNYATTNPNSLRM